MQTAIVIIAIAASVVYAAWRIYLVLKHRNDPCTSCQGCPLHERKYKKYDCEQKTAKKFGRKKK